MTLEDVALGRLFDPRSACVVGASLTPGKWGHELARRLLRSAGRRQVFLVNGRGGSMFGHDCLASVEDLPHAVDVAFLCIPSSQVLSTVERLVAVGCRYVVCVTAGFAELGVEGIEQEARLVEAAERGGARLIGPNCAGIYDADGGLDMLAWSDPSPGSVAIVSQSGMVAIEVAERLRRGGLGVSRAISVGNQPDVDIAESLDALSSHSATRAVLVYPEGIGDGRRLFASIERCVSAGKGVVVLAPDSVAGVRRAMASHTGSLATDTALLDAACCDVGAVRATSVRDAVSALRACHSPVRPRGRRVGLVADSGGIAALAAASVETAGLDLPVFSPALQAELGAVLGPGSGVTNPVDAARFGNFEALMPALQKIAFSGEVDSLLLSGMMFDEHAGEAEGDAVANFAALLRDDGIYLSASVLADSSPAARRLIALGVPVFDSSDDMALALASRSVAPSRAFPVAVGANSAGPIREELFDYFDAREVLAGAGVAFNAARRVRDDDDACEVAEELGFPVVLKALGLNHKSDVGGVALGLRTSEELKDRLARMREVTGATEFSVEAMVPGGNGVEVLVGGLRDLAFGPVVAVGLGGVLAEAIGDTVFALAPVDQAAALGMLLRLRGGALLGRFRGRPAIDREAIARAIVAVGRLLADRPDILEIDINPVIATSDRALAVDARILRAAS